MLRNADMEDVRRLIRDNDGTVLFFLSSVSYNSGLFSYIASAQICAIFSSGRLLALLIITSRSFCITPHQRTCPSKVVPRQLRQLSRTSCYAQSNIPISEWRIRRRNERSQKAVPPDAYIDNTKLSSNANSREIAFDRNTRS